MHTFGRCWGASSYILTLYLQHCLLGSSPRAKQEAQRCIVKAGQTGNDGEPVQKAKVPAHYQNHLQPKKIMGQRRHSEERWCSSLSAPLKKPENMFFLKKWTTQWALTKWRAAAIPQNPVCFSLQRSCSPRVGYHRAYHRLHTRHRFSLSVQ